MSNKNKNEARRNNSNLLGIDLFRLLHTPLLYQFMALAAILPASVQIMMGGIVAGFSVAGLINSIATAALFVLVGILLAVFTGTDYSSGFNKNIFTVSPKKRSYVASKIIAGSFGGICILLAYMLGAIIFGVLADGSFAMNIFEVLMGIIAKGCQMVFFCSIFMVVNVIFKGKTLLSVLFTLMSAMLLSPAILVTSSMSQVVSAGMSAVAAVLSLIGFSSFSSFLMNKKDLL